jgi:hypothetical protein
MADYIRPTPRNPLLGLLSDAITGGVDWMRDPRRAQQMQGFGGLLAETGIPATLERLSYGEPLTTGRGMTTRLRPEAEAALMTLGPEAVPIGRGAMAAVKATKGLPVGAATVYHGSPYRFQRFDPTKIGSGEGAQAYGYGHYVAESPDVAKEYRTALSEPELFVKGRQIKTAVGSNMDTAKAWLQDSFEMGAKNPYADAIEKVSNALLKDKQGVIDSLRKLESRGVQMQKGGFEYEIDLPDPAIARMLDWDKPLSEQAQAKAVLDRIGKEIALPRMQDAEGVGFAYQHLANAVGGPRNASALLRNEGIPGIRYLDQGSRGNGSIFQRFGTEAEAQAYAKKAGGTTVVQPRQGGFVVVGEPAKTSNFVVFPGEEDLLRILSVNGGLLAP